MPIMIAYSQSDEGAAALHQGRDLAERLDLPVVVFHLGAKSTDADRRLEPTPDVGREGERWLAPAATAPDSVDDLLDSVSELGADMVVVGVRRRSPVGKLILGSQAQRLILDATVPVVAVKTSVGS